MENATSPPVRRWRRAPTAGSPSPPTRTVASGFTPPSRSSSASCVPAATAAAFSPDGRRVAVTGLWHRDLGCPDRQGRSPTCSPTATRAASSSAPTASSWRRATTPAPCASTGPAGGAHAAIKAAGAVTSLAWSPDGEQLAVGTDTGALDAASGDAPAAAGTRLASYSPDDVDAAGKLAEPPGDRRRRRRLRGLSPRGRHAAALDRPVRRLGLGQDLLHARLCARVAPARRATRATPASCSATRLLQAHRADRVQRLALRRGQPVGQPGRAHPRQPRPLTGRAGRPGGEAQGQVVKQITAQRGVDTRRAGRSSPATQASLEATARPPRRAGRELARSRRGRARAGLAAAPGRRHRARRDRQGRRARGAGPPSGETFADLVRRADDARTSSSTAARPPRRSCTRPIAAAASRGSWSCSSARPRRRCSRGLLSPTS